MSACGMRTNNVQIGAADRSACHLHNGVSGRVYNRLGSILKHFLVRAEIDECFHVESPVAQD